MGYGKFGPLIGAIDEGTSSARFLVSRHKNIQLNNIFFILLFICRFLLQKMLKF